MSLSSGDFVKGDSVISSGDSVGGFRRGTSSGDSVKDEELAEGDPIIHLDSLLRNADEQVRRGFVQKVYGIVSAQILATIVVVLPFHWVDEGTVAVVGIPLMFFSCAAAIYGTVLVLKDAAPSNALRTYPHNFKILAMVTAATATVVGLTTSQFTAQSVVSALGLTLAVFVALSVYAFWTDADLSGAEPYIVAVGAVMSLFTLCLLIISIFGFPFEWAVWFDSCSSALLFSLFVVSDTQRMLGGTHKVAFSIDDYCLAAITLHMDIIDMFLTLLRICGDRKK